MRETPAMVEPEASRRGIGAVLAEFAQEMANERSSADILNRLSEYCTELLPVHGVGILLKNAQGGVEVGTVNTAEGHVVEHLQADLHEGPCTDCLASGTYVAVPDLELAGEQYPRFAPRALEAGIRAIHALPMTARTEVIGALDILATEVLDLTAEQISTAQLLADVAISYVSNSRAFEEKSRLASQLQHALDSRILIEQAKGILSERRTITVTEAFELLRTYARSNHLKLHDVAGAIVRGQLDL